MRASKMITSSFFLEKGKKRSSCYSKRGWARFRKARSSWESGAWRAVIPAKPSVQARGPCSQAREMAGASASCTQCSSLPTSLNPSLLIVTLHLTPRFSNIPLKQTRSSEPWPFSNLSSPAPSTSMAPPSLLSFLTLLALPGRRPSLMIFTLA